MFKWIYNKLFDYAYPDYKCEDCISMADYGCECGYHECIAPRKPPTWRHKLVRYFLRKINLTEQW